VQRRFNSISSCRFIRSLPNAATSNHRSRRRTVVGRDAWFGSLCFPFLRYDQFQGEN
jgi:hypothetical protein